jgi:hypothetical protein
VVGQPPQRGLHQVGHPSQPAVVGGLRQQAGEQVPDPRWCGPQPVVFVVVAQQHLRHRQADDLGVGDLGWAAGAGTLPGRSQGMMRSVNST